MTVLQPFPRPARGPIDPRAQIAVLGLVVLAGLTGYLAVTSPSAVVLLYAVPIVVWLLSQRVFALTVLAVTLPYVADISGGAVGVNVAISDVLLPFLVLGLLLEWVAAGRAPELRAIRPLGFVLAWYVGVVLVLLVAHPAFAGLVSTYQRIGLLVLPLLVGALVARQERELWFLRAYLVGASVTAALWLAGVELGQKNPVGQFIANGLILLLAVKDLRRRTVWLVPLLVAGTLWTQSRGAIASVGVAFAVLLVVQPGARARGRSALLALPVAALTVALFRFLPEEAQQRNLTFTAGNESAGEWAIKVREAYHADAWELIHAHPWTGVGLGRYLTGSQYEGTLTNDPHQVLLLEGAEGGYLLMVSFLVLTGGALLVTWRVCRHAPLGPTAVAVNAAIIGHGLVDVYWVRGTPVLGWLVTGMALMQAYSVREQTRPAEPVPAEART